MIAVDTSALMAILLDEPEADSCIAALSGPDDLVISAGTMAEALIVAKARGLGAQMEQLLDGLGFDVIPVTAASARDIAAIYARWGKGLHPAGLNFGDCFAYEAAAQHACPLLYVGQDFSRTDLAPALI